MSDAIMPVMGEVEFGEQIKKARGGGISTALLVYGAGSFELVSGQLLVYTDEYNNTAFWVADRCVAMLSRDGEIVAVPALRSLRTDYAYPVEQLMLERIAAAPAAGPAGTVEEPDVAAG